MVIIQTIILGIIEGLTEFIPVSSTAHLLLSSVILNIPKDLGNTLSISIQAGAIFASVVFFWKTLINNLSLIPKILVGFLPTALAGVFLYPYIKIIFSNQKIIALALILGGVLLILIKPKNQTSKIENITYKNSFLIGLMQIFSFIPGMSRSGSTLIGGTILKIPRNDIVPFSFLLAIPTILGASFIEIINNPNIINLNWKLLLIGSITAFIIALLTIKFFINFLTNKPLSYFGWYRILIGFLVLLLI